MNMLMTEPVKDFWRSHKGLVLVSETGDLRFTAAGRAHYAPLLAKYHLSISTVKTLGQFQEVMGPVNAGELDDNTQKLLRMLDDPNTTDDERETIKRILDL